MTDITRTYGGACVGDVFVSPVESVRPVLEAPWVEDVHYRVCESSGCFAIISLPASIVVQLDDDGKLRTGPFEVTFQRAERPVRSQRMGVLETMPAVRSIGVVTVGSEQYLFEDDDADGVWRQIREDFPELPRSATVVVLPEVKITYRGLIDAKCDQTAIKLSRLNRR